MKADWMIFILFSTICLCMASCGQKAGKDASESAIQKSGALSAEADLKLREDFAAYMSEKWPGITAEDVAVLYYYGTYNGQEAVVLYGREYLMTDDIKEIEAAGYRITLPSGSLDLLIHIDSSFLPIQDAYEQGYISENDVYMIQQAAFPADTSDSNLE